MEGQLTDSLVAVNGPEDGTAYALLRSRLTIGSDAGCDIVLGRDETVRRRHAEALATSRGYRIRSVDGGPLFVNGRPVRRIGPRIMVDGDIVQVGQSELLLKTLDGAQSFEHLFGEEQENGAPAGAGGISRVFNGILGVIAWVWYVVTDAFATAGHAITWALGTVLSNRKVFVRLVIIAALVAAYFLAPGFRSIVDAAVVAVAQFFRFAADTLSLETGR